MPELVASGDLFSAQGDAGFETGIVHGNVVGEVTIGVTAEAELCHGAEIGLGVKASAEAEALIAILLPALRAEGQAFASAGVGVNGQVSPNLFDKIGFTARAKAQAQASVAGRIGIGLDFHTVAALARDQMSNLAYDIFIAFLNELIVEAGVWGKASFAAMARAQLQINGTLSSDEDSRFVITAGADVGLGGGTGWDFYGGLKFKDIKRFYNTSAHLITDEVVREAKARLPSHFKPAIELLDLLLPTSLVAAFELGQMSALELVRWAEQADQNAAPFGRAFQRQLQRFVIDKFSIAAGLILERYLGDFISRIAPDSMSATQKAELTQTIKTLITELQSGPFTTARFPILVAGIIDIVLVVAPEELRLWRRPLTIAWCAMTLGEAIRVAGSNAGAGISIGAIGVGSVSANVSINAIAAPPEVVRDELNWFFDPAADVIMPSDAVDYLLSVGMSEVLEDLVPEVAEMFASLNQLLGTIDLTTGDVVEAALRGAAGEDLTDTELYQNLRNWMDVSIEYQIVGELIPALRAELDDNDDALLYLDEVVEPSLLMTKNFVFKSMDRVVLVANRPEPGAEFYDTFKTGLSSLVWRIMSRNVVVISDILIHHAVTNLHLGFSGIRTEIDANSNHPFVNGGTDLLSTTFPNLQAHPDDTRIAVQDLFSDLAHAGALAFGPQVWTPDRRVEMRTLMISLLESIDSDLDYTSEDEIEQFFGQLAKCFFVPNLNTLHELGDLLLTVTLEELAIVFERVLPALEIFWLRLTLTTVNDMEQLAHEWINEIARLVREAWKEFKKWEKEALMLFGELQVLIQATAVQLGALSDALDNEQIIDDIMNEIRSRGLDNAEDLAEAAPGYDALPSGAKDTAVATAQGVFLTSFIVIGPLIRGALAVLSDVAQTSADVVSATGSLPDEISALANEMADQVYDTVDPLGLGWPDALNIDDVTAAAHKVVSDSAGIALALEDYLLARIDENDKQIAYDLAEEKRLINENLWKAERDRQSEHLGDTIIVHVHSPHALEGQPSQNWLYPKEVPLYIEVVGAKPSYVRADAPRRILVALNGETLQFAAGAWEFVEEEHAMVLRHTLTTQNSSLRDGLNSLEVSAVDGIDQRKRSAINFAVDTSLDAQPGRLEVAGDLSQFDAPGNDHVNLAQEYVTLRNVGGRALDLTDWRIADRIGHQFKFPTFELQAQSIVKIHTGSGNNDSNDLYWGRGQAVWNNRGDAVYLIDEVHVLHAEHVY